VEAVHVVWAAGSLVFDQKGDEECCFVALMVGLGFLDALWFNPSPSRGLSFTSFEEHFPLGISNGASRGDLIGHMASPRFHYRLPASYYGDREGVGTVSKLSRFGCRLNSGTQMQPGNELTLHLYIRDGDRPLVIDRTAVRWSNGSEAELLFLFVQNEERDRLSKFLTAQSATKDKT